MWAVARYQQAEFENLSARASALRVGESSLADAEELLRLYKSRAASEYENCPASSCDLSMSIANFLWRPPSPEEPEGHLLWINTHLLRRVGIRPAIAVVFVTVHNGKIQKVNFGAVYESPGGDWLWGHWGAVDKLPPALKCESLAQRHPAYVVRREFQHRDPRGPSVWAFFQSTANQAERTRCQYIRFACMTNPFDCANGTTLEAGPFMPLVYQDILTDEAVRKANPEKYRKDLEDCESGKLLPE